MRYAFYRGKEWLGATPQPTTQLRLLQQEQKKMPSKSKPSLDYRMNLHFQNDAIQKGNWKNYDTLRRGKNKGVQIQKVK